MPTLFEEIQLPTDFAAVTDDQLAELESVASAAAQPLADRVTAGDDTVTDDELEGLTRLASVVQGVRDERATRFAAESAAVTKKKKGADAAALFAAKTEPAEPVNPPAGDSGKPAVARPSVADVSAAATGAPDTTATGTEVGPEREAYTKMVAAAGALGVASGAEFPDLISAARAVEDRMATYSGTGYRQDPVVMWRREYPEELRINAQDGWKASLDKMDFAAQQSRLPGGGLVAAAGWCAPSQILYDLYEIEDGTYGILDVPELQISRGGIQFTPGPDFSAIWGGAGYWHYTEAQIQAAALPSTNLKPTMVVPCPSFSEKRLETEGVQITGAFLQDRGYPEMVARFIRGAMIAHRRRMNLFKINQIVLNSTNIDYTNLANMPATTSEAKDLTAVSRLLTVFGFQAMDYRLRYRMAEDAMLEGVLPAWVLELCAQDVQRRWGIDFDDAMTLSTEEVVSYFTAKNIRMQFVYDWQDAYNTVGSTNSTNLGSSSTQLYTFPRTVWGLLFSPGTWVAGVSDIIRLDTVYDSTNLSLNQYTKLFSEEGVLMAKRGYESRLIKAPVDPSGTVSATTAMVDG